jgi:hypothetical protein
MRASAEHDVIVTRAALERAEQEAMKEHRKDLIAKLAAVRKEKREAEAACLKLATRIKAEREWEADMRTRISQAKEAVGDSWVARPPIAAYLPDDPAVMVWRQEHEARAGSIRTGSGPCLRRCGAREVRFGEAESAQHPQYRSSGLRAAM